MAKYRLPEDVKLTALSYVKGYPRRKAEYMMKFNDIVAGKGFPFETYTINGYDERGDPCELECRVPIDRVFGNIGNPTQQKAFLLEQLSRHPETVRMRAVERAMELIGDRIMNDELRKKLVQAIMLNCDSGRVYIYKDMDLPGISRKAFFAERRRFLWYVAKYSDLLWEE